MMNIVSLAVGCLSCSLVLAVSTSINAASRQLSISQQTPSVASEAQSVNKVNPSANRMIAEKQMYIVRLADAPLATYEGGVKGLSATSNKMTGAKKLNVNSKHSKAYRKYLKKNQENFRKQTGTTGQVKSEFQIIFNGMAMELSEREAKTLRNNPNVLSVSKERMEKPLTDSGPGLIGADVIWQGPPNNVPHSQGEGLVIAILDTGINQNHPSFADIGGDGYDHTNPLGSGNYIPGSYCDTNPDFCNDKLIGAWSFVNESVTPADSDGHGSHTASTAAGNYISQATIESPTTGLSRDISGVAPHANIIAYDVCINTCPTSALLAAVEQVVIDSSNLPNGIHALNYSISGGENPYNDVIELAFLNATAAGVYVAASAGNNGPGEATVAHNSPWVSTTASMTHERRLVNEVTNLSSDGIELASITGVGFTGGYGPARIINSADLEADFPGSTLCGLGGQGAYSPPWPPGTFNGEIVACTRGVFGRVEKGANLLAAGAGGYILMDNGNGIVGDPHVLPAVHINQSDSATLAAWLASNSNTTAEIKGLTVDVQPSNADVMAGSSSRGPSTNVDVIKPDLGAPGVSIMAAAPTADNYMFLSGTSMASPHNAGAGAIVAGARPDWSPYAIKSAIMMTANNHSGVKEDGVSLADAHDFGAGRIDLSRTTEVGLVLNETPQNFLLANPDNGGDPTGLNIASMQNSNCVDSCSWTRTFTNVTKHTIHVELSVENSGGVSYSVSPNRLKVKRGKSASFTVTANGVYQEEWQFADLLVARKGDGPDLHMPIAVKGGLSTDPAVLSKTVDKANANAGDTLRYTIEVAAATESGTFDVTDVLPTGGDYVDGSATYSVVNGSTSIPFEENNGVLSWQGELDKQEFAVKAGASKYGYVPLTRFGTPPLRLPSNCDDGGLVINVAPFEYNSQEYSQVIWSVNGTLEAGIASGQAASHSHEELPNESLPNNLMAPWWTDLNMCRGGNWYVEQLSDGEDVFTVFEWKDVPLFGDDSATSTFQVWIVHTTNEIFYVYDTLAGDDATIGAEDATGTSGSSYYYNGAGSKPTSSDDLTIAQDGGGVAVLQFDVTANCDAETIVNKAELSQNGEQELALAVTKVSGC
ncbi:S8 family serine peptidase [Paraferrimonas haliotis]|uniref:Uncharacterized protein n=1 Tax=Paraferrimonas haliotis TaxID=2013866 RepID=A0AA37WWD4_9GAMM|nr:S8 family serine peptidase [Paraferrimonas haliotis]GLS82279.1 hypothetical protein GCM10007894_02560 [Paraferrimonas haliotis]